MNRRARVFLVAPLAILLALLVLSTTPGPAAGFPTRSGYDRMIVASGAGPIAAGDVNGDGRTDLVAVDDASGAIQVFLQGGGGLPSNPTTAIQGLIPRRVLLADMDRDGRTDLVSMGSNSTLIHYQDAIGFAGRTQDGINLNCSMVFQSFALLPWLTVEQNVMIGLEARGLDEPIRHKRAGSRPRLGRLLR